MLQFITDSFAKLSIPEQVKTVIDGGCRWIQLRMTGAADSDVHNMAVELIPLCRDSGTILVIEGHIDVANELKVSGVHLNKGNIAPAAARELLGPHAIIGCEAENAGDIIALKGLDIDYATISPVFPVPGAEALKPTIESVRAAGVELPIVAAGGIALENAVTAMAAGANGVAAGKAISGAAIPTAYTAEILDRLQKFRETGH